MAALCAKARCGLVLMHMKGTPRTMQDDPVYDDVVADVRAFLTDRMTAAIGAGVAEADLARPESGSARRWQPRADRPARGAARLGRPVVLGASRKSASWAS